MRRDRNNSEQNKQTTKHAFIGEMNALDHVNKGRKGTNTLDP